MTSPTNSEKVNSKVKALVAKAAVALLLATAPLAAFGVMTIDNTQVSLAGSGYPDDVDPG